MHIAVFVGTRYPRWRLHRVTWDVIDRVFGTFGHSNRPHCVIKGFYFIAYMSMCKIQKVLGIL